MIRTPTGLMLEAQALAIFEQVGFTPPPGSSTQDAFLMLLELARQEEPHAGSRCDYTRSDRLWGMAMQPRDSAGPANTADTEPQTLKEQPGALLVLEVVQPDADGDYPCNLDKAHGQAVQKAGRDDCLQDDGHQDHAKKEHE